MKIAAGSRAASRIPAREGNGGRNTRNGTNVKAKIELLGNILQHRHSGRRRLRRRARGGDSDRVYERGAVQNVLLSGGVSARAQRRLARVQRSANRDGTTRDAGGIQTRIRHSQVLQINVPSVRDGDGIINIL